MDIEIQELRKQLPRKGYVKLLQDAITNPADKSLATRDVIINFFGGRAVKHNTKKVIIKSVKVAVEKLKKEQKELQQLIKS